MSDKNEGEGRRRPSTEEILRSLGFGPVVPDAEFYESMSDEVESGLPERGRSKISRLFANKAKMEPPRPASRYKHVFYDFVLVWQDVIDDIKAIRESGHYDVDEYKLFGRLQYGALNGEEKIFLLIGYAKEGERLVHPDAEVPPGCIKAGLVMSAPIRRITHTGEYFRDYERGLDEGVFLGMKEHKAEMATRYAMDREKVSNYAERFPSIVTPLQERHLLANLECWITEQIETSLGRKPRGELSLDI